MIVTNKSVSTLILNTMDRTKIKLYQLNLEKDRNTIINFIL